MMGALQYLNANSGVLMLIFSAVVAISSVVYAHLTRLLVDETRKMRQAQTDPRIEVFLKPREEWINLVYLCVRNIGLGPAYDIAFRIEKTGNTSGAEALVNDFAQSKFFETGVRYLGPGHDLFSNPTQMTKQFEEKIDAILIVNVTYRNAVGVQIADSYRLDLSEWRGRRQGGIPHLYTISQTLDRMQKDIQRLASGFQRLNVDIYDSEDRKREVEDIETREQKQEEQ